MWAEKPDCSRSSQWNYPRLDLVSHQGRYFVFEDWVIGNITDYFKRHYLYLFLWTFISLGQVKCFFQQNINFCFSFFAGMCLGYFWHLCWASQFGSNNFQLGWSVTAYWHRLNWTSGGQQEPERCQHCCSECWTSKGALTKAASGRSNALFSSITGGPSLILSHFLQLLDNSSLPFWNVRFWWCNNDR